MPDLADRNAVNFGDLSSDLRFRILDRATSLVGLTLSIQPEYRRVDEVSGALGHGYSLPITILIDKVVVPGKLLAAANIIYTPGVSRFDSGPAIGANSGWQNESGFAAYGAMTALIRPNVFLGAEIRYLSAFQGTFLNRQDGYAITLGPSLCLQLSEKSFLKFAWASQIAGKAAGVPGTLDLVNFERNEARVRLVLGF